MDARLLRRGLQDNGYSELPIKSEHAMFIDSLPSVHSGQFDRLLVSVQRRGNLLRSADSTVAHYLAPVRSV